MSMGLSPTPPAVAKPCSVLAVPGSRPSGARGPALLCSFSSPSSGCRARALKQDAAGPREQSG